MIAKGNSRTGVSGSCLCGGVAFEVREFSRQVVACHCSQCRKTSGHFVAATKARTRDITFSSDETLTWFRSSKEAERGFCNRCGGNLFYRVVRADAMSIMAGALDPPTGLKIDRHIFVSDASDYYQIERGAVTFSKNDT